MEVVVGEETGAVVGEGAEAVESAGSSTGLTDSEPVVNSETRQSARPSRLTVPKTIWGIDRWNMVTPSNA